VENRRKKKEEVVERTSVCIWGLELTSIRSLLDEELPRPNRLSPTGATFGSAATRLLAKRKREDKLTHAGMAATKKDWTGHGKFRSTQPVSYHANLPTQPGFLQSIEMLAATSQIMPAVSV
jgi:hypothetical protein